MSSHLATVKNAIAHTHKPDQVTIVGDQFLIRLAKELSGIQSAAEAAPALVKLNSWLDSLTSLTKSVKQMISNVVQERGEKVTEKGGMAYSEGDWTMQIKPHRTGVDPKKLEARLRSKKADLDFYMDRTIVYTFNQSKLDAAVEAGVLSSEDVEACKHELTYDVMAPKRNE
jgi:hypothetical protein